MSTNSQRGLLQGSKWRSLYCLPVFTWGKKHKERVGWDLTSFLLDAWFLNIYIYMRHIDARLCDRWISLVCWLLLLCLQQDGAYLLSVNNEGEFEFISQWLTRSELDRWGQVFLNQGERLSKRPSWELDKTPEKPMYTEAGDDVHVTIPSRVLSRDYF